MPAPISRAAQHGVALITAVLIVAFATILAVNVAIPRQARTAAQRHDVRARQGYEIALGAEASAAEFLQKHRQDSQTDHRGEIWARPLPPLPIDGGKVEGRLEDMQGRFNMNNLS